MPKQPPIVIAGALICASLVAHGESIPPIPITVGSEAVRVITDAHIEVPEKCILIGPIEAEDGNVGADRWRYEGTEERAIQRMKNSAVRFHADTIKIEQRAESLESGSRFGHEVWLYGKAYKCNPD